MFELGLADEAKNIMNKYGQVKPLEAIGYKEVVEYLNGNCDLSETKKLIKLHTLQYAKRQMKWFKRDKTIKWISNYRQADKLVRDFI